MQRTYKLTSLAILVPILVALTACGGGGGDGGAASSGGQPAPQADLPPPPAPTLSTLRVTSYDPVTQGRPSKVITNDQGDRIEFWSVRSAAGVLTPQQARLQLKSGGVTRVFYDASGVPTRFQNELTGEFVTQTFIDDKLFVQAYQADGTFVEGYRVSVVKGRATVAPILGRAFFPGQLSLDLEGGIRPASAVLLPSAEIGVGAAEELPTQFQVFLNGGTPVATAWTLRPAMAKALGFVIGNAHAQTANPQIASGIASSAIGAYLAVAGYYAPAIVPLLVGSAAAPWLTPLVAGGLVVAAGWNLANGITDIIGGGIRLVSDTTNQFADGVAPETILSQQVASISSAGTLVSSLRTANQTVGSAADALSVWLSEVAQVVAGTLPVVDTALTGSAVDSSGATVALSGSVGQSGGFSAQGTGSTNALTVTGSLTNQGQATGTYSGYLGAGSLSGSTSALGQCQQVQNSGGRGTFVRAHNLGVTTGISMFSFDAYAIPDQFTVSTNGFAAFGTNGLVSGAGSAAIPLSGSSIVFVAVNAPNSGTAWEYQLSCP